MKKRLSEQFVGLIVALLLLLAAMTGIFVLHRRDLAREQKMDARAHSAYVKDSLAAAVAERDSLREVWAQQKHERDSLRPIWEAQKAAREKQRQQWAAEKEARRLAREAENNIEIILQPFDPNTADSTTLVHLGLRPWMARSVVHYREKGGRYRKVDDFRKAYGMTDSLFLTLAPYITIADSFALQSVAHRFPQKKDTLLNLNTADTTELQYLRGIGSYTARKIVEYRKQLGGFASVEQLREVQPAIQHIDSVLPHLWVSEQDIRPLLINRLSVDALARHKYISFTQARAIYEYRHKKGAVRSEEALRALKLNNRLVFQENDIVRLRAYISYEE